MAKIIMTGLSVIHNGEKTAHGDLELRLCLGSRGSSYPLLSIGDTDSTVLFHPDTWPRMRDEIQGLIDNSGIH